MPYFYYSLYFFCSLCSYRYIKNHPIFKLLIDK
nr:MAG TPA: Sas10/Utp3/C1D family [Caudoviricetes sp.]